MRLAHIEDDPAFAFLFQLVCEKLRINYTHFSSLERFIRSGKEFDLVFTDLNLPHHKGIEVIDLILPLNGNIYVLSGVGNQNVEQMRDIYQKAGAKDFFSKDLFAGAHGLDSLSRVIKEVKSHE